VRLTNGWLAVVTEQNTADLLKPAVRAFYCTTARASIAPVDIDLARNQDYRIVADENAAQWGVNPLQCLQNARH
jgi:hypothetical protein